MHSIAVIPYSLPDPAIDHFHRRRLGFVFVEVDGIDLDCCFITTPGRASIRS